ncbi:hypothetical protein SAMN05443572_109273 [Myxococcus fulvus]|nr:hypothetical protein [Myxococcus fulvus]SEU33338.1 hypothetical protein SAMN05443572_109273 [Myxococcus fulvus]
MSISPHQGQDSTHDELDVIKATRCGWTLNGHLVKDNIINVPAGITNVLLFETAPDLVDPSIHLRTTGAPPRLPIDLFVPTDVPIHDFLPAGQYILICRFRDILAGDINGTLNVGTGTEDPRGDANVSV